MASSSHSRSRSRSPRDGAVMNAPLQPAAAAAGAAGALNPVGVVELGNPYAMALSLQSQAAAAAHGFRVDFKYHEGDPLPVEHIYPVSQHQQKVVVREHVYVAAELPIWEHSPLGHELYRICHESHYIRKYRSVLMCAVCGRYVQTRMPTAGIDNLIGPCPKVRNRYGIQNMENIMHGFFPKCGGRWADGPPAPVPPLPPVLPAQADEAAAQPAVPLPALPAPADEAAGPEAGSDAADGGNSFYSEGDSAEHDDGS
ncbi:unnamed protein product [Prorocentrum cordatum]|uniref:DNA-directed RNA polymerase n=1 Tax=Prorocentrum cordatum TaxID=2364126 RepID=A0ABN9V4H4_9DINO|nr:unnamed protein product [Polarella glacialis]